MEEETYFYLHLHIYQSIHITSSSSTTWLFDVEGWVVLLRLCAGFPGACDVLGLNDFEILVGIAFALAFCEGPEDMVCTFNNFDVVIPVLLFAILDIGCFCCLAIILAFSSDSLDILAAARGDMFPVFIGFFGTEVSGTVFCWTFTLC